ncbi:MAG TPA: choice-of-anchor tandem repeat GloVer-containing protein [Verrucomicrobiae bacterium]|nr:choice-of-anchor tandem repeat GloVer-containing protein [Verrucomicrobiae bacterium]
MFDTAVFARSTPRWAIGFAGILTAITPLMGFAQAETNYQRILSTGPTSANGSFPRGQLLEGQDGFLYGTTYAGGSNNLGTVFKVAKNGAHFSLLHSFNDGDFPYAGVVQGSNGTLFGTTSGGGTNNGGTLYRINPDGTGFSVLVNFGVTNGDAVAPAAGLAQGADGALYGTASNGGTNNLGAIFKINQDGGNYSLLYSFGSTSGDGTLPFGALVQGRDGALYGTTQSGGTSNLGTVFKLNPDGSGYQILHNFTGPAADGRLPLGTLVQGADDFLYGTTYYGGTNDLGAIFKIDTNGNNYAVLRSFAAGQDGSQPVAGLARGTDGALYGSTRYGGSADSGFVFKLNGDGSGFTVLHVFSQLTSDGAQSFAPLLLGSDGALYGTTFYGGSFSTNGANGTVFRLFPFPPAITITAITLSPTGTSLTFVGGAAGQTYSIQAAPDPVLGPWQTIGSRVAAIDGTFAFIDPASPVQTTRFYRTSLP